MPKYFTSLGGDGGHWKNTGAPAIYSPTATGFRVYLRNLSMPLTRESANSSRWHINWQARP